MGVTLQHSYPRHYSTSLRVEGLISDEVMTFFKLPNPPILFMAVELSQASNRNQYRESSWGKGPLELEADLTAFCEPTIYKMWEPRCLTTLWASTACYRDSFAFLMAKSFSNKRMGKGS
jgi:hypothetical protein